MENKRIEAFERAYTLNADENQRREMLAWMRSYRVKGGYSHSTLHNVYFGFCMALDAHTSNK